MTKGQKTVEQAEVNCEDRTNDLRGLLRDIEAAEPSPQRDAAMATLSKALDTLHAARKDLSTAYYAVGAFERN
tara:strand:+ start:2407 stop:2625 length:219 start_codon:yes stop_codon:yes gene_type:complete